MLVRLIATFPLFCHISAVFGYKLSALDYISAIRIATIVGHISNSALILVPDDSLIFVM